MYLCNKTFLLAGYSAGISSQHFVDIWGGHIYVVDGLSPPSDRAYPRPHLTSTATQKLSTSPFPSQRRSLFHTVRGAHIGNAKPILIMTMLPHPLLRPPPPASQTPDAAPSCTPFPPPSRRRLRSKSTRTWPSAAWPLGKTWVRIP